LYWRSLDCRDAIYNNLRSVGLLSKMVYCGKCGASSSGKFCGSCGAQIGGPICNSCEKVISGKVYDLGKYNCIQMTQYNVMQSSCGVEEYNL
jgi:hypothetical protein